MPSGTVSVPRILRVVGLFILDTVAVLVGPAIAESPLHPMFPVHSAAGVLRRESMLSILCAGLIGFLAYWRWRSATSKMVWALFLLGFGFGILVSAAEPGGPRAQLSGAECSITLNRSDCQTFWLFTVPMIRGLSYSCGAFLASWFYRPRLDDAAGRDRG
jgi:hypothetical protein